jgi:hypothetical protein
MRSKRSFSPVLEASEARFLLSGMVAAHATPAVAEDVGRGELLYLTGIVKDSTPIYSIVITNDTGHLLDVTVSAKGHDRDLSGNLSKGGTVAARGKFLLFSNDANFTFTIGLKSKQESKLSSRFSFAADEAKQSTGYKFPALQNFAANASNSAPFSVKIEESSSGVRSLKVVPG